MKNRFKRDRLCSSENYILSRILHNEYLKECHDNNITVIEEITKHIIIKKKAYAKIFGELIPISEEELHIIDKSLVIYM